MLCSSTRCTVCSNKHLAFLHSCICLGCWLIFRRGRERYRTSCVISRTLKQRCFHVWSSSTSVANDQPTGGRLLFKHEIVERKKHVGGRLETVKVHLPTRGEQILRVWLPPGYSREVRAGGSARSDMYVITLEDELLCQPEANCVLSATT